MAAPVVIGAVKVIGPKNLGKIVLYLLAAVIGAILAIPALVLGIVAVATGASSGQTAAVPAGAAGGPLVVGEWASPMSGYDLRRGFGWNPVAGCTFCSKDHKGQDLGNGCGSPIYATGPGTVTLAGRSGGYGITVIIDHGAGISTLYAHMPPGGPTVAVGDVVTAGKQVGVEGTSGNSTGCHLHFEVRQNGQPIDPAPFMRDRGIQL